MSISFFLLPSSSYSHFALGVDTEYLAINQQCNKHVALPPSAHQYAVHAVIVVVPVVEVVVVLVIVVVIVVLIVVVVVVVVTEHLTIKAW